MIARASKSQGFIASIYNSVALRFIALLLIFMLNVQADSPLTGYTPSALTLGSPAGSYPLSGFENINIFNGNLAIDLRVGQVAGRGAAQ